ncbi:hypothetical protein C2845_PM11G12660 [Panicum miliaceum]|uniref:Uncharacterized protein n=1 Tax=Panicum miliaceum TaxID=4540 RepID=A0A3L6RTU8_PANMI|nr:hypothetical protein C2845_PM11G12660 [Panicum miliaceum]
MARPALALATATSRATTPSMATVTCSKVAGRPKTERHKGNGNKKKRKGQHKCPICEKLEHHWHSCKRGKPEDIEAMKAIKGPPKKKAESAHSYIVPLEDDALAATISFPPSQSMEISRKTKGKQKKTSSALSEGSRSGSNQPNHFPSNNL